MKLLGHVNPEMTMRYVDVAGTDFQREFHLARSQPRHLALQLKAPNVSPRGGLDGVVDSLLFAQHAIEMFRRRCRTALPSIASINSRIDSPKSSRKPATQTEGIAGRDWPYKATNRQLDGKRHAVSDG
jgi:hypothetical protein